jgi:hypothetical protein
VDDSAKITGDESLVILESLLCLMREKNLLSRSDIELLCAKVGRRAVGESQNPLPCHSKSAQGAHTYLRQLANYLGHRYGGKHSRQVMQTSLAPDARSDNQAMSTN